MNLLHWSDGTRTRLNSWRASWWCTSLPHTGHFGHASIYYWTPKRFTTVGVFSITSVSLPSKYDIGRGIWDRSVDVLPNLKWMLMWELLISITVKNAKLKDCRDRWSHLKSSYLVSRGTLLPSTKLSCSGTLSGGVVCSSAGDWPATGAVLPEEGVNCRDEFRVCPAWCVEPRAWLRAVTEGCWRWGGGTGGRLGPWWLDDCSVNSRKDWFRTVGSQKYSNTSCKLSFMIDHE